MIIAILGMLLIVKPEFSSSVIPSIAGLLSGIFAASAYTCVRALSTREKPYTIVFYFSLFSVVVQFLYLLYIDNNSFLTRRWIISSCRTNWYNISL